MKYKKHYHKMKYKKHYLMMNNNRYNVEKTNKIFYKQNNLNNNN